MFFSISLLTLLLANFVPVLASPAVAHAPPIPAPQFNPHPARSINVLPVPTDPETNGTLVKRDWKTTCKGVTLCTEEDFKGTCMSWCYEPDKFEDLFARAAKDLRSVRLEKGADCWFVKYVSPDNMVFESHRQIWIADCWCQIGSWLQNEHVHQVQHPKQTDDFHDPAGGKHPVASERHFGLFHLPQREGGLPHVVPGHCRNLRRLEEQARGIILAA